MRQLGLLNCVRCKVPFAWLAGRGVLSVEGRNPIIYNGAKSVCTGQFPGIGQGENLETKKGSRIRSGRRPS